MACQGRCEVVPFARDSVPAVRGYLHRPSAPLPEALVLAHGAGSNCEAPLLAALAAAFAGAGFTVLRCDLPYRQKRPHGPPFPVEASRDREGIRNAVSALRESMPEGSRVFLGGHSYGGRQATMLAAAGPSIAEGLLLASYPLHPPRRPLQLRTDHLPSLRTPALFLHGDRDPFGSLDEMRAALKLIPARTRLVPIEGAGHDLLPARRGAGAAAHITEFAQGVLEALCAFFGIEAAAPPDGQYT